MDLTHLANIAEILGVVAIVFSLIYVSRQLRQTNAMMKNAAASERLERDYELVLPLIESRDFADIWTKGDRNFDELDHVDQQRLIFFERRAIVLWHHTFQMNKQGLFLDASWHETVSIMQSLGRRQAIRETWNLFGHHFHADFVAFVEEQFAIGDARVDEKQ
jgi:hypothetical protein